MTRSNKLVAYLATLSLFFAVGCHSSNAAPGSDTAEAETTLPSGAPVAVEYSSYPDVAFAGVGLIDVTSIPYHGIEGGQLRVELRAESVEPTGTVMGLVVAVDLETAKRLIAGETVYEPAGYLSTPVNNDPRADAIPSPSLVDVRLALRSATIELDATARDGSLVGARGHFSIGCTFEEEGGGVINDGLWETTFCRDVRSVLGLGPWIDAAR